MSLVFSLEVNLKSLSIVGDIIFVPSLSIVIADNEETIFPWCPSTEASQNPNMDIRKTYQIMVAADIFAALRSWPVKFNIMTAKDHVILGSTVYEFKSMLANALNACGRSKQKEIEASLKGQDGNEIARLKLVAAVEYVPGNEHKDLVEVIATQPIAIDNEQDNAYQPQIDEQKPEDTEIEDSDLSIQTSTTSSDQDFVSERSLLAGHSSFKAAGQTNRSKLSAAQKNASTARSAVSVGQSTFTTDFIDYDEI